MKRRDFVAGGSVLAGASFASAVRNALSASPTASNAQSNASATPSPAPATPVYLPPPAASMTLNALHALMSHECGDSSGVYFAIDWLIDNLRHGIRATTALTASLSYPTANDKIWAGLEIDPNGVDIALAANGHIYLRKFEFVIVLREKPAGAGRGRAYSRATITYHDVKLKLEPDVDQPGNIRFYLSATDPKSADWPRFTGPTFQRFDDVIADNGFVDSARPQFDALEQAIVVSNAPISVLDAFVQSIPLLTLVDAMRQFRIGVPMKFTFRDGLIIVRGPLDIGGDHSCGPMAGTRVVSAISPPAARPITTSGGKEQNGFSMTLNHQVSPVDTTRTTDQIKFGCYHPIKFTWQILAQNTIGPAIAASDHGAAGVFHWAYYASVRPRSATLSGIVTKVPGSNLPAMRLELAAPFDAAGLLTLSMKVGCVEVPLTSSSLIGFVDPSVFTFTIGLANTPTGPAVVVTTSYNCAVDVSFHSPPVLDLILNIVMGSFGNRIVADKLRERVNDLTFRLIDLSSLGYKFSADSFQPNPKAIWHLGQDHRTDSVLLALSQHVGD
jgi:hypothetical protein